MNWELVAQIAALALVACFASVIGVAVVGAHRDSEQKRAQDRQKFENEQAALLQRGLSVQPGGVVIRTDGDPEETARRITEGRA